MFNKIVFTLIVLFITAGAAFSGDGDFDSTFDGDGVAVYDGNFSGDIGRSVALQEDGKIVVGGGGAVFRYNRNGVLDNTFDGDGIATYPIGFGHSVAIQPDGKILIAGESGIGEAEILRYNSDGTLDATFGGGDGIVTYRMGDASTFFTAVRLQNDGKIVAAGFADDPTYKTLVMRYNGDGTLDTTFAADGIATHKNNAISGAHHCDVAIQSDGKIVVVTTYVSEGRQADIMVLRYNSNGQPDTTFSADGEVRYHAPNNDDYYGYGAAIQADGKIMVVGQMYTITRPYTNSWDAIILRYNGNGTLDTTFNGTGVAAYDSGNDDGGRAVAIQADGKIVVAGFHSVYPARGNMLILRYNRDGQLDKTFSRDGVVRYNNGVPDYHEANAVVIQPDGKIVITGGLSIFANMITMRLIGQSVRLLSPNGGDSITPGSTFNVQWEATNQAAVKFNLKYSLDNGAAWQPITSSPVAGTSYAWTVPQPLGNKQNCRVKVIAYDTNDIKVGTDKSDAPFNIVVVKLTSPDGGATFTSGDQHAITWFTNGVASEAKVTLSYTLNDGLTWKTINTTADPLNDGSFFWTVPNVSKTKTNCKVKLVLKDASGKTLGNDKSDAVFTINPAP